MKLTITIERPVHALSPNARSHWRTRAGAAAKARKYGYLQAFASLPGVEPPMWPRATVSILWIMPTKAHHPDPMNASAWLKAHIDGICDWGMLPNDKGLIPVWEGMIVSKTYTDHVGQSWPRGCVVLTFEELKV